MPVAPAFVLHLAKIVNTYMSPFSKNSSNFAIGPLMNDLAEQGKTSVNAMTEDEISAARNYTATLASYRAHLSQQWLQPHTLERVIDRQLKSEFLAAREVLDQYKDEKSIGLIETGDYLIQCYEDLVAGKAVAGLAEAEGGYNYYLRVRRENPSDLALQPDLLLFSIRR